MRRRSKRPPVPYEICDKCGKRTYRSEKAALRVARTARTGGHLRPYRDHGTWHLSSQPQMSGAGKGQRRP